MAPSNFRRALDEVLKHEGGYSNHRFDPGGATNFGITQRTYDEFRVERGKPPQSVREITMAEVSECYNERYWARVQGDSLPPGVDLCVFDAAVNSGPLRAARWLQGAVFAMQDGYIGEATLAAVAVEKSETVIERMCDARTAFLMALPTFEHFGRGWLRRVNAVEKTSLEWAASGPVVITPPSDPKPRNLLDCVRRWMRSRAK